MHMARFKHFLSFGEFCPGLSSAGWISSGFKSSAEVDVSCAHVSAANPCSGENWWVTFLPVPGMQGALISGMSHGQKAVVNILFFFFPPLLRCKFYFCFGLLCQCSIKHVAGRCEGLTKMSVDVYGDSTRVNMRIIVNTLEITAIPRRLRFPGGATSLSDPIASWWWVEQSLVPAYWPGLDSLRSGSAACPKMYCWLPGWHRRSTKKKPNQKKSPVTGESLCLKQFSTRESQSPDIRQGLRRSWSILEIPAVLEVVCKAPVLLLNFHALL